MTLDLVLLAPYAATAVALLSAILATRQARSARRANRVDQLEARLEQSEADRNLLWFYCRQLVDHIYRGNPPPPPTPPEGLFK